MIAHVAINLSSINFHDPEFAQHVGRTLQKHGLSSHDLMMEITESVMFDISPATLKNLHVLQAMGIRLSMDDFGTALPTYRPTDLPPYRLIALGRVQPRRWRGCRWFQRPANRGYRL